MKFVDILDDCFINEEVKSKYDKRYCKLLLSRKELSMIRWALKTKDAIDDVLDDEMDISYKQRNDNK